MISAAGKELRDLSWFNEQGRFRKGALAVALIGASMLVAFASKLIVWARSGVPPRADILFYGLQFAAYIMITAWVVLLAIRHSARDGRWFRTFIPAYFIGLAAFVLVRWIGDQWLLPLFGAETNYPPDVGFLSFALDNLTYGTIPFLFGTLLYFIESQFIGLAFRLRLAHEQRASELDMLRARVAPHFLYNTLNNLYALSLRPGSQVSAPLHDLAELMRHITKRDGTVRPLAEEWALVQRFVALQALRFERPLNLRLQADETVLRTEMRALVLLPLLENAFKHGDPCDQGIPLSLSVSTRDDRLHVRCENRMSRHPTDDGPSTGLRDLERLLQLLYDGRASSSFAPSGDRFIAELHIPLEHA